MFKCVFNRKYFTALVAATTLIIALLLPFSQTVCTIMAASSSDLLTAMEITDYVGDSITVKNARLSASEINLKMKSGVRRVEGPTFTQYTEIMEKEWKDCTQYSKKTSKLSVDLNKRMEYSAYVKLLKKLSRYDGVSLYRIGKSVEGKAIYSIVIDIGGKTEDKDVIMLSGLVHSREQGGGMFVLKSLVDLVMSAQTDKEIQEMLKKYKYVAVPWVSLDVSEAMKWDSTAYNESGTYWKSAADGVDINRCFPSMTAGWRLNSVNESWTNTRKAGAQYYAGKYLGANPETKAMMKWLYHYVVVEKAVAYIDFHQQGRIVYNGQPICGSAQNKLNAVFADKLAKHTGYRAVGPSAVKDDYDGSGGNTTEYVMSIALGKYSPKYGSYVFCDGKNEILPTDVLNADGARNAGYNIKTVNDRMLAITMEIGSGATYLGGSQATYSKNAAEYTNYHFDTLLTALPGMIEGTLK